MYLMNKYISFSDICLTVHHLYIYIYIIYKTN